MTTAEKKQEKKERIDALINKIEDGVKSGFVIEKQFGEVTGCVLCVFKNECQPNYRLPCMAHNRRKYDSIYYARKER